MAGCTLTPEMRARVLSVARRGVSVKLIAEAAGVPVDTLNGWLYRSRHTDSAALAGFADEFARARGAAAVESVDQVREAAAGAAAGDWKAAAWLLERTRGEEFGSKMYLEAAREQVTDAIIEGLRGKLDKDTYARVLSALCEDESERGTGANEPDSQRILEAEIVRADP
jgi:hypothetical protein